MNSKCILSKLVLTAYSNKYFNGWIPQEMINHCIYLYYILINPSINCGYHWNKFLSMILMHISGPIRIIFTS